MALSALRVRASPSRERRPQTQKPKRWTRARDTSLGEKVGDRVDSHEAEVDGDLERPAAHDRVGGEVSGQRGMRADDGG
jgi:hypothetical protein